MDVSMLTPFVPFFVVAAIGGVAVGLAHWHSLWLTGKPSLVSIALNIFGVGVGVLFIDFAEMSATLGWWRAAGAILACVTGGFALPFVVFFGQFVLGDILDSLRLRVRRH